MKKEYQRFPPPAFHIMAKPRGAICNLDCQYCFYLKKEALYPDSKFFMSDEILESFTRQYIKAQIVPEVTFTWQGGEPTLMGLDFFKRALYFQKKYQKPGMRIYNTIQTNGTKLDDVWGRFFKLHDFLVGLSLDGPREIHDAYRLDKGGNPTYARVMNGLSILKKHKVEFNILTCVSSANAKHPLEVYRFLRDDIKTQFIQFIPIVERDNQTGYQEGTRVTPRTVSGEAYGHFLISIFDEWVKRDVGRVFIQIFDVALGAWYGQPAGLCIFNQTCGAALAMEHNGDLYSCDHFVEPRYLLGNIEDDKLLPLVGSESQIQFGQSKSDKLPNYCRECEVRFICNGGCPKNRILATPDGEMGLNYLCDGYKAFFTHIDPAMKEMVRMLNNRRPPADIMKFK
jgi:uncharacterized protein